MKQMTIQRWITTIFMLLAALAVTILITVNIGSEPANIFGHLDETTKTIILYSRLPRILLGMLAGIALGSGGTAFQALLRNPLADPYILGVSGGAALGSVIGFALRLPFPLIAGLAFLSSFATMFFIYWASRYHGRLPAHTLLLTGVIFNTFTFAIIMLVHSIVTMEQAHEILFTLIGNLEIQSYKMIAVVAIGVLSGFAILTMLAYKLNVISIGDETAIHLGINIDRTRKTVFFAASLMIGAVVSVTGLIGFVGLFIPHIARLIFGSDHRLVLPASGIIGAIFLIWSDTLARTLLMSGEYQTQLPVGVITALIGGPVFVYLLKRQMK